MGFLQKAMRSAPAGKTTRARGNEAKNWALAHLQEAELNLLGRNYRMPGRGGGEIDLIMREPDGTVVFVEVRRRAAADFGGTGTSNQAGKQRRIMFAARECLMRLHTPPPLPI